MVCAITEMRFGCCVAMQSWGYSALPYGGCWRDFQEIPPERLDLEEIQSTQNAATFFSEMKCVLYNILWSKSYPLDNMGWFFFCI